MRRDGGPVTPYEAGLNDALEKLAILGAAVRPLRNAIMGVRQFMNADRVAMAKAAPFAFAKNVVAPAVAANSAAAAAKHGPRVMGIAEQFFM